jgi:ribosomal protein S27AE
VAYLVIALGFALAGGIVGRLKGSSFFLWFLISGALPFVGLVAALLYRWDRDEPRRQCPRCGSIVMLHDAVCTRCGAELEYPDVVLAPESASSRPRAS